MRFRNTLRDTRDTVFVFLAIVVGFAAGVQAITVGAVASVIFNLVLLFIWRSDFGRNALAPTAGSQQWAEPLKLLAESKGESATATASVHDHDIVLALTPQKVDALADRFNRVRRIVGKKKPRYNALLSFTTRGARASCSPASSRRWTSSPSAGSSTKSSSGDGKPSELTYLVKLKKTMPGDALMTEIRSVVGSKLLGCDFELSDALEEARLKPPAKGARRQDERPSHRRGRSGHVRGRERVSTGRRGEEHARCRQHGARRARGPTRDARSVSATRASPNSDGERKAVARWILPHDLDELSGLALTPDGRLLAQGDERGKISEIDYRRGIIVKQFTRRAPGRQGRFRGHHV